MWPSENPWLVVVVCLIGLVVSTILWASRRQYWTLILGGVFLALALGAFAWDRMVVTPREQVIADVHGITQAFQQRDLERTYSYISKSAWDVQLLAAEGYNLIQIQDDMRVSDIQVEMLARGQRALTRFRVNGTFVASSLGSRRMATMWEAKWQLENEGWKMIEIIALDPVTGAQQGYLESHRQRVRSLYRK